MLQINDYIVKHRAELLNLADKLGNISKAYKMMRVSRDKFYCYKEAVDNNSVESLFGKNRQRPNIKNQVYPNIEMAITQCIIDEPDHGQVCVSSTLCCQGIFVSASGVRSTMLRKAIITSFT